MRKKTKKDIILDEILRFVLAIIWIAVVLFFILLFSICVPITGWWFFRHIFAPYLGYYTHYWQFIPLPAIIAFLFFIFYNIDEILE